MLYVIGCLEEAGIIFASAAFDEDVAEALISSAVDWIPPFLRWSGTTSAQVEMKSNKQK